MGEGVSPSPIIWDLSELLRRTSVASSREIEERIERVIIECGHLGVKPTPETVADIIVDQDIHSTGVEPTEARCSYAEYMETARRVLMLGQTPRRPCSHGGEELSRGERRPLSREVGKP